jgi:hypothetical protein
MKFAGDPWVWRNQERSAMDINFNLIIGIVGVAFGCMTLLARLFGWERMLSKRGPMKERFGERTGDIIHLVSYTILPIVAGLLFLRAGLAL